MSKILAPARTLAEGRIIVNIVQSDGVDDFQKRIGGICDGWNHLLGLSLDRPEVSTLLDKANYCWEMENIYGDSLTPAELNALLNDVVAGVDAHEKMVDALASPEFQRFMKAFRKCPDLEPLIAGPRQIATGLSKIRDQASKLQPQIPKDDGRRDYPFRKAFILFAHDMYRAAGGSRKGSNEIPKKKRVDPEIVYGGPFYEFVEAALEIALGDRFDLSNSQLGGAIDRALENKRFYGPND